MPVTNQPSVRELAQNLLTKATLARADVDGLLNRAMEDGKLSSAERKQIRMVIDKFTTTPTSDEAVARLKGFLDIRSTALRSLAHTLEANDGVIDASEAKKIVDVLKADGTVSGNERLSLGAILVASRMTDEARAVITAALGGTVTPAAGLIDLGLQRLGGKDYKLSPDGYLTSGRAVSFDAVGALEMYQAAEALVATAGKPLMTVEADIKVKMLAFLERAFSAGVDSTRLPAVSTQRIRSAAASTLLALIDGASSTDGDLKKRAVDLYLKQALAEPLHGLRASMYFNLDRVRSSLDPATVTKLDDLKLDVIPQKPPYEAWFSANGSRTINVVHYAHKECWDFGTDPIAQYQAQGYAVVEDRSSSRPPKWILEKTNSDAPGGAIKARIEVIQSHDGIFQQMDDPKTNVVLYTGHSNLGGNVSEELRLGRDEKGSKLILMALCRGKQNMHEIANKYPNSHFVTSDQPSYFSSVIPMALGMVEGCLNGRAYDQMKQATPQISDVGGKNNYFYPHEARRYDHYDVDKDGYLDGHGAHTDKLFNITLKPPTVKRTDGVVRPNDLDERNIDATNVSHATQFLNTVVTYHVDHHNNSSKLGPRDMDNFKPAGWFDGPASERVRVRTQPDGSMSVSVNKGLFDQSWAVLGTIVQFEVTKQLLQERNGGVLTKNDEARAMLFAGEYLAYMYCSQEEAEMGIAAIAKDSRFFHGTNFAHLYRAVAADGHGYVTDAQMNELLRLRP